MNTIAPLVSEIADYLRTTATEDPLPTKSQERVLMTAAEGIKGNQAVKAGRCNFCSREAEHAMPMTMKMCKNCCQRAIKFGTGLQMGERSIGEYHCDKCFALTFETFRTNPRMCPSCLKSMARFSKFNNNDAKRDAQLRAQRKAKMRGAPHAV